MTIKKGEDWIRHAKGCIAQLNGPDAMKALDKALAELDRARDWERYYYNEERRWHQNSVASIKSIKRLERDLDDLTRRANDVKAELVAREHELEEWQDTAAQWQLNAEIAEEQAAECREKLQWQTREKRRAIETATVKAITPQAFRRLYEQRPLAAEGE